MKLSCICLLDPQSSAKLRKLSEQISFECNSKNALQFPPHFSLRNDFKITTNKLEELTVDLRQIISKYSTFNISLTNYGFYSWKIVYLDINRNKVLNTLHKDTLQTIQKYRTEWVPPMLLENKSFTGIQRDYIYKYGYQFCLEYYSPHITLAGNDMSEQNFQKVKKSLLNKYENIDSKVIQVALVNRSDNNNLLEIFKLA